MRVEAGGPSARASMPDALYSVFARTVVKAMRQTLRNDGPMSGGAGARLFGHVLEEALAEALASGRARREFVA